VAQSEDKGFAVCQPEHGCLALTAVRLCPRCPTSPLTREKSREVSAPCRQPRQAALPPATLPYDRNAF